MGSTSGVTRSSGGYQAYDLNNELTSSKCDAAAVVEEAKGALTGAIVQGARGTAGVFPSLPCDAAALPDLFMEYGVSYTNMGRPVELGSGTEGYGHSHVQGYDERGRVMERNTNYGDATDLFTRSFVHSYDDAGGTYSRVGPDGVETFVQVDLAGRVQFARRGPVGSPLMTVNYTYYADDRVQRMTYGNGASVNYEYDDARRLTAIDHRDPLNQTFLRLEYAYSVDDLPISITEYDAIGATAITEFTYDNRDRLIHEARAEFGGTGETEYDLAYEYDQGGNRLRKVDALNDIEVVYHYDPEDPDGYGSYNNRLMYYQTLSTAGQSSTLLATTWYYYNEFGNPERVVTESTADPGMYSATRFGYARNGRAVMFLVKETWEADGADADACPENYAVTYAREFRYDAGRARYLNRELDPVFLMQGFRMAINSVWTDYDAGPGGDGDDVYGDYTVASGDPPVMTEENSYEAGMWRSVDGASEMLHNDMIGTLRQSTDVGGAAIAPRVFTTFGETISSTTDRYGYAGTWQYQSHGEFAYQHVGYRYYDSASGRFLQRDQLGIRGGVNVYQYVDAMPSYEIDPQ